MSRKKELETTTGLIKYVLTKYPSSRNSDTILYLKVMEKLNKGSSKMPFVDVLNNLEELGLPCWDSVTRIRRKIQEENPDLRCNDFTQKHRDENEKDYRKYAKS